MDNTHYALGGTNVLLIFLVPGGKKCFIDPFWSLAAPFSQYTLAPGGTIFVPQ
jgi:hypothetical protein